MNNAPHFEKCITPIEGSNNNGVEHFMRRLHNIKGPIARTRTRDEGRKRDEHEQDNKESTNGTGPGRAEHEQNGEDTAETNTNRTAHAETNATRTR